MSEVEDKFDYSEFTKSESSDKLGQLSLLVDEAKVLENTIAEEEEKISKLREEYKDFIERKIPEVMDGLNLEEIVTTAGFTVEINEKIRCSIAKKNQKAAYEWLRKRGKSSIIKRVLSVSFGPGEEEDANTLSSLLSKDYDANDSSSIHAQTLKAFIVRELAEGTNVPFELFGIFRQRVAKIST